jgi:hypothetical protein
LETKLWKLLFPNLLQRREVYRKDFFFLLQYWGWNRGPHTY